MLPEDLKYRLEDIDLVYKMITRPRAYCLEHADIIFIEKHENLEEWIVSWKEETFPINNSFVKERLSFTDPYVAAECFIDLSYRYNEEDDEERIPDFFLGDDFEDFVMKYKKIGAINPIEGKIKECQN